MKTMVYTVFTDQEFSDLVNKHFTPKAGRDWYSYAADEEQSNGSARTYNNIKALDFDNYDQDEIDAFVEDGEYSFSAYSFLKGLIAKGILEEGNFLIETSW